MKRMLRSVLVGIFFFGALSSCVEDLDFNQFEDLEATPTFEASILFLEAPENIINLVNGTDVFSQNFNFEAFSSDFFADRVIDGVITYVVENTTSKELEITIELVDENDIVTDTEIFRLEPEPTPILQREITYGDSGRSIDIIKTLTTIRVTARNLGDNTSISNLPDPIITVRSSGQFRVRLR